jgi:hypothetical protein
MAKEKSIPAQTSKDAQKDPLAATEMILLVATPGGNQQILDARRRDARLGGTYRAAWHPQPA